MLYPFWCVAVTVHIGLFRQFKKGEHIVIPRIQKDMHVRIISACARDMVFGNGELEIHIQMGLIKLYRLFGIAATIGDMMKTVCFDGH